MACNSNDYQFTKVPTKLYLCLDNNCRSMLFTLIQLSTMFGDEQGWFFRSNADMEAETGLSKKVMDGTLDALLQKGLIDFIPQQQGQGVKQSSRKYKVNYDSFLAYEKITLDDCIKNPEYKVFTSDYKGGAFSWKGKEWAGKKASLSLGSTPASTPTSTPTLSQPQHKVPTSKDTIDIGDNINNILKINYLSNSITDAKGNGAAHCNRANNTIQHPSSSFADSLELNDDAEPYHPSSSHVDSLELNDDMVSYHPSSRSSSTLHDGCLKYVCKRAPSEMDTGEYLEYWLSAALTKLVRMNEGALTKEDELFYNARKTYMELYRVNDSKQATKDINVLKSKVKKILEDHRMAS